MLLMLLVSQGANLPLAGGMYKQAQPIEQPGMPNSTRTDTTRHQAICRRNVSHITPKDAYKVASKLKRKQRLLDNRTDD